MLEKKGAYIYSIEGKDLYKKTIEIKKGRKFKASLDYSLESIQIEKVAQAVYKNKKDKENIFYQEEEKQYTNKVINLTFKYNVKEYNLITIKESKYYVHLNSELDSKKIKEIVFDNGVYIKDSIIQAIEIGAETTLISKEIPQGFGIKDGKIYLTTTGTKTIANSDKVREDLYKDGFNIKYSEKTTIEYVRFKRSSGSSRVGKCLFIDKRLYKDILEWSMMGLVFGFDEEIDLAGLEAYISLTVSSIIDTIQIEPKNILLIDDYESVFKDTVMITKVVKEKYIDDNGEEKERDRLFTEPKETEITNSIWDGESMGDESLFEEKYKDKGFILLRNRMVKTAVFNCGVQRFFADNNITEISQLNGKTIATKIEDIKLITTPSSIKYLKYGTWENFISRCTDEWGVVKYDKPTHYFNGRMVQTHYQLLNTIQMDETETKLLLKDSLDYVKLLKTDIRVFREHLHIKIKDSIEYGEINSTDEFMMTMLQLNNRFENTDLFNKFRQDSIESYVRNMKKGHILIRGNYSVLCGNGIEMLKASCKDKEGKLLFNRVSVLDKDEVCCKNFSYGKPLIGSRSPHVTIGNIWLPKNANKVKFDIISKYFNSSKQIVHVNSIKTNVLERLSSADFDSDALLLSDNELLISKAKINYDKFLVPTSMVEAKKVARLNNAEQKCDLDIKTSKNLIGEIINCSQILNSQLWDLLNSKKYKIEDKEITELYAIISQLDVMSCIEIDRAKKEFSVDNQLELDDIRGKHINDNKKPMFFGFLSKEKIIKQNKKNKDVEKTIKYNSKKYRKHKTTMDYLINVISKEVRGMTQNYRKGENAIVTFGELLSKDGDVKIANASITVCKSIIEKSLETKQKINNAWNNENLTSEEKYKNTSDIKNDFLNLVSQKLVTSATIKKIIYDLNLDSKKIKDNIEIRTELNKASRQLLSVLYKAHKDAFIELFTESKEKIETIKRCNKMESGKQYIKIYDMNYEVQNKE
jgi:hypothetical protein